MAKKTTKTEDKNRFIQSKFKFIYSSPNIEKIPHSAGLKEVIKGISVDPAYYNKKDIIHFKNENQTLEIYKATNKTNLAMQIGYIAPDKRTRSKTTKMFLYIASSIYNTLLDGKTLKSDKLEIDLADLVNKGMYSRNDKAIAGFERIKQGLFSIRLAYEEINENGKIKTIESSGLKFLFTGYDRPRGTKVYIDINPKVEWYKLCKYYTGIHNNFYALSDNGSLLMLLIANEMTRQQKHLARQGFIRIPLKTVLETLSLDPNERKFKENVVDVIEEALTNIEDECKKEFYLMEFDCTDNKKNQTSREAFLNGYLKVYLPTNLTNKITP